MEKVESSNRFLPPSGGWAGAQCRIADQKQHICFLTSLHPPPVEVAKVTKQGGYSICHPSPATEPLANTLVFNLSSLMEWHQYLHSHHSLWALSGDFVQVGEWGGDVQGRKCINIRAGSTFFEFVTLPWPLDFYTQFECVQAEKAVATQISGNH